MRKGGRWVGKGGGPADQVWGGGWSGRKRWRTHLRRWRSNQRRWRSQRRRCRSHLISWMGDWSWEGGWFEDWWWGGDQREDPLVSSSFSSTALPQVRHRSWHRNRLCLFSCAHPPHIYVLEDSGIPNFFLWFYSFALHPTWLRSWFSHAFPKAILSQWLIIIALVGRESIRVMISLDDSFLLSRNFSQRGLRIKTETTKFDIVNVELTII